MLRVNGIWKGQATFTIFQCEGETIETTSFFAPVLKEFIVIRGDSLTGKKAENIRFENLAFEFAGYQSAATGQ